MEILEGLWNTTLSYKGMRVNVFGVHKPYKETSVRNALSRLKSKGYVETNSREWSLTNSGRNYLIRKRNYLIKFDSPFTKGSPRNLLIMFDIPEVRKAERKWFRDHLREFNYIMIQKSVWVGPSPLPKEFVDYIKKVGLSSCIKKFKLAIPYKITK